MSYTADVINGGDLVGFYVVEGRGNCVFRLIGTKTGRAFKSEEAAERLARRMENDNPRQDFVVLPVFEYGGVA